MAHIKVIRSEPVVNPITQTVDIDFDVEKNDGEDFGAASPDFMPCAGLCGGYIPRSTWKVRCYKCYRRTAAATRFQGQRGRADFLTAGTIPGYAPRRRVFAGGRYENRGNMHPRP